MPTLGDIDRHGEIQATVRRILELCVRQREASFDDGHDDTLLNALASAPRAQPIGQSREPSDYRSWQNVIGAAVRYLDPRIGFFSKKLKEAV